MGRPGSEEEGSSWRSWAVGRGSGLEGQRATGLGLESQGPKTSLGDLAREPELCGKRGQRNGSIIGSLKNEINRMKQME